MFEDFYSTFATLSLTVTGLWMFIATVRFREWTAARDPVRQASAVSVQLAIPGLMCLFALIDADSELLWRAAFGVASVLAAVLLLLLQRTSPRRWPVANSVGNWLAALLFACIALVAASPEIVDELGVGMVPRNVEFFLFCLLLTDGLVVGWLMLFAEVHDAPGDDRQAAGSSTVSTS
ncbi:MAG: hypothetical protein M3203_03215 [Actinomycetota bacterium]|nr:hypothetical protein [Actinomycetota bacterium]